MPGCLVPPRAKSPEYCRRIVLWCKRPDGSVSWQALNCGSWSCESCRPYVTARLRTRLFAAQFNARWFVTLTMDPAKLEARDIDAGPEGYRDQTIWMRRAFARWIARLRRRFGPCGYVRVAEFQRAVDWRGRPNGRLHLHVLLETAAYGLFLKYSAEELGFGCQLDVQLVREVDDCYSYLRKYMTKGQPDSYTFRVRRFSASRGVLPPEPKEPSEGRWALGRFEPHVVDWVAESLSAEIKQEGARSVCADPGVRSWLEFRDDLWRAWHEKRGDRRRRDAAFWGEVDAAAAVCDGAAGSLRPGSSGPRRAGGVEKQSSFLRPPSMGSHGER